MSNPTSSYILHSELILGACLLGDRALAEGILFGTNLQKEDLLPRNFYQETYAAIVQTLRTPDATPTPELVWTNSGKKLPLDELRKWRSAAVGNSSDALKSSAVAVIRLADRQETHKHITNALQDLMDEQNPTGEVRSKLIGELSRVRVSEVQASDTASILARFEDNLGQGQFKPAPTYLAWFKAITNGGFRKRRLIGLAGADKSRKTTLLRNLILSVVRRHPDSKNDFHGWDYLPNKNVSVAILAYENDQESILFDFVAMLAFEKLWEEGRGRADLATIVEGKQVRSLLNSEIIMTALDGKRFGRWPETLKSAILWAMEAIKFLPIHIYDQNPRNGGLRTADDMTRVLNMHAILSGAEFNIAAVDYNGLIQTPGMSLYEGQTEVVARQLYAANALDYTILALAQFSRTHQKESADPKKENGTVGTDNSPALERSCHNYWQVSYNEDEPQKLNVKQVRARRFAGGTKGGVKSAFWIDQNTGTLLGNYDTSIRLLPD